MNIIDPACRNRGYATQCAGALLCHAFETAGVPFVNGGCDKNNKASLRVMEKAGMLPDGFEPNGDPLYYIDAAGYAAGRSERRAE